MARPAGSRTRARSARTGRRAAAVIVAALIAAALWFWPEPAQPPLVVETPRPVEAPTAVRGAAVLHARTAVRKRPAPPAPRANPIDEAQLRAAVASRAPDLRACSLPAGSPPQIPARLRVTAAGVPKAVELSGPYPVPSALAECLRERMLAWRFADLQLASDVDVLVTFALR